MQIWKNFDIELFDHDRLGDVETVQVRVARTPGAGEQRNAVSVVISKPLRVAAKALANDELNLKQTIELGQLLAEVLLPGEAVDLFENSVAKLATDEGLRLRIELRSLPLADLPWEYVYKRPTNFDDKAPERGFLGLNRSLSIVRYEPVAQAPGSVSSLKKDSIKVSMLLANPNIPGLASLDLDKEIEAVESALENESDIVLSIERNATNQTLNNTLDARPDVFHFAGHGRFKIQAMNAQGVSTGRGELLFETDTGGPDPVLAKELAAKMRGSGVRLAVLNNCESAKRDTLNAFTGVAPTLVRDGVPAVIAMQYKVRDEHAIQFAQRLYFNLAAHKSIDDAVTAARLAMFETGGTYRRDWGLPVLYLRSDESVLFPDSPAIESPPVVKYGKRGAINVLLSSLLVVALVIFYKRHIELLLPADNIVGGVFLVGLMAALAFLKFVAGDSFLVYLQTWLKKASATGILVAALLVPLISLYMLSPPRYMRIVADKGLIAKIARRDLDEPRLKYQLVIEADGIEISNEDFRKSGVTISGTSSEADRLGMHYSEQVEKEFEKNLIAQGIFDKRQAYLGLWQDRPAFMELGGFGKVKKMHIKLKSSRGKIVSCQNIEMGKNMVVVFMQENNSGC